MKTGKNMEETEYWYKTAVFYQIHIKCYRDSNSDGIGDFKGLTEKLNHIQNLGCNAIWLQPFYPSPLRDDGYDIADYTSINKDYGTLKDFKIFLKEAHRRGIKVISELVINHTSDQHLWFQRARRAPKGSNYRDYYIWEDKPEKYSDARIIFKDFETSNWAWDPVAEAYYFHRFYSHQPDLNYDNPNVHKEIFKVADFWLDMGVDGMRLDAIPYLYKRDGTDCENLPETHAFLKKLRAHIDSKYKGRMLLAEANQWPEQACAYFGNGDECNMAFHFPVMPRLFMSIRMEDRFPIMDILDQTPTPPESCQWAMFLRNHDELTLEMVTDEERDYMWRVYAKDPRARINLGIRRRLAPLLENDRSKIELMNILLFSLPGSPVIYYGDEIGMGDNYYLGDRNGVRTPMQWNNDRNAGFSSCNPQKLYLPLIIDPQYHYEHLTVENQEHSVSSLLWWMRMAVSVRQRYKAFGLGTITFLNPSNNKVLAFIREYKNEKILVVVNLSRFAQYVELNLAEYNGYTPVDLFSQNEFSPLRNDLYGLTLGRYGYFWLNLVMKEAKNLPIDQKHLVSFQFGDKWQDILKGSHKAKFLQETLPGYITGCRWFRSKARVIKNIQIIEEMAIENALLLFIQVHYQDDSTETYLLPISFVSDDVSHSLLAHYPEAVIATVKLSHTSGHLIDSTYDPSFQGALFSTLREKRKPKGKNGKLHATISKHFKVNGIKGDQKDALQSRILGADQTNSSLSFADRYFLKIYRRIEEGTNPDVELQGHLSENSNFSSIPKYLGKIEWQGDLQNPVTLAMLQEYIPNSQDVWAYSVDALGRFFDEVLAQQSQWEKWLETERNPKFLSEEAVPQQIGDAIGIFRNTAELLGKKTADMHLALISNCQSKDMAVEPFTMLYQKSLYQALRTQAKKSLALLKEKLSKLPPDLQKITQEVIGSESKILNRYSYLQNKKVSACKIRIHGDLHLGQVLFTGKDLLFIDFEGEPQLPLGERRLKRSPLQDIAGMVRSFHYASLTALSRYKAVRKELKANLEPFANLWYRHVSNIYLKAYLNEMQKQSINLVPKNKEEFMTLLETYILNKALYEVGYELQNRPDWVSIPVKGLQMLLKES